MNIKEKLAVIQHDLKVPKSKPNRFGGYKYRNVDMILENIKPLLKEQRCILTLNDEVVQVGERVYVRATAVIEETDGDGGIGVSGWAREQLERKKSDDSQLTGAASTYARKRALEGLFLLDGSGDVTDPDEYEDDPDEELDQQEEAEKEPEEKKPVERKPRSRRKKAAEEETDKEQELQEQEDTIAKVFGGPFDPETGLPTMENDEEDGKVQEKDAYFHIPGKGHGNYIKLHKGDEIPEGAEPITEDQWKEGCTAIAQKQEPESKPVTRRSRKKRS